MPRRQEIPENFRRLVVSSPVGELLLESSGEALTRLDFIEDGDTRAPTDTGVQVDVILASAARQMEEYFRGRRRSFDLPLAPAGTEFQRRVWHALRSIPFGSTTTYGEIARRIGQASASRAVGAANGRNPIGIIVPCHRVMGAAGDLVGYGGGMDRKRWLLDHERDALGRLFASPARTIGC